jgi:asparagine synthase (glutamine-hydrolysing)
MCRIVGFIGYQRNSIDDIEKTIINMRDVVAHGGPDDCGVHIDTNKGLALGHRRLSILDLSTLGHQPMSNDDETIWITYNGEIYNFVEIRRTLKTGGYRFRSNTDTEVVLKCYEEWGEKAFAKFAGMFAFAIYDKRKGLIYLVRDQAGIKPLYYSTSGQILIFASEIKSFKAFDPRWKENEDWRTYFLIFGHIPEPFTVLHNVFMIPKGSFIKFDITTKTHSSHDYTTTGLTQEIKDFPEAKEQIRKHFLIAVKRHLISDAPIGVFLSGGIDSSLIALVASQFLNDNLRTLSVIFDEREFSEEEYQKIVLNRIKSNHKSYLVSEKDFTESVEDIFKVMDQPTTDGVNTYFISKCAHEEGLKTVLSGIGGDELFGGYPSFDRIDKVWFLRELNGYIKRLFNLFEHATSHEIKKLSFLSIPNPLSLYLLFRGLFSIKTVSQILEIDRKKIIEALESIYMKNTTSLNKRDFVSCIETNLYMQNQLLRDTDFMSMCHSLEVRVPFLDRDFLEVAFSIDEKIRFANGTPKHLLAKSFEDILPKDLISRKKQGFSFPLQIWMRNNIDLLSSYIHNRNKPIVKKIIYEFKSHNLHWSRFWSLVVLNQKSYA